MAINTEKFYEEQKLKNIERVVLAEDIELPEINTEPLTLELLQELSDKNSYYKLAINEYSDMNAKFFLPIMTPLVDTDNARDSTKSSPSLNGNKGDSLKSSSYNSTNYITLVIPKYILLNFVSVVPKGTVFVVGSVGGKLNIDEMKIIGLYSTSATNTLSKSKGGSR
jgi:hypothetical protein